MTRHDQPDDDGHVDPTKRPGPLPPNSDHDEAVLNAEVRRLVNALSPYGVLSRDVLRRVVGAQRWHEPWFDRALDAAVAERRIEALPLGFYGLRR